METDFVLDFFVFLKTLRALLSGTTCFDNLTTGIDVGSAEAERRDKSVVRHFFFFTNLDAGIDVGSAEAEVTHFGYYLCICLAFDFRRTDRVL